MALIASINGATREIFLSLSTVNTTINPIDVYKEMRTLRRTDETLRKYDVFLSAFGKVAKGGGKFTERYVRENAGTRIIPYDADQELTINGVIITDDGQEGVACFKRTGLTSTTVVDINYIPPQVEVIEVSTGSAVTAQDKLDIAAAVRTELAVEMSEISANDAKLTPMQVQLIEMWRIAGLDSANPLTVTPTSIDAGAISHVISGDGSTTSTVTRQP